MAGKPQPLIIEKGEFRVFLFAQMRVKDISPQEFADELGISLSTLYAILNGDEQPSEDLAKKVGVRQVWVMDRDVPAKSAKGKK